MAETLSQMIIDMRQKFNSNSYKDPKDVERDYKDINELICYRIIKETPFYGTILSQVSKSFSVKFPFPAAVNIKKSGFMLYVNPFSIMTMNEFSSKEELDSYMADNELTEPPVINRNTNIDTLIKNIMAVYVHEIYHLIMLHLTRRIPYMGTHDARLMNIAMDLAINQFIDNLPDGCLDLNKFRIDADLPHLEPKREWEYYLEEIEKNRNNPKTKETLEKYGMDTRSKPEKIRDFLNQLEKAMNGENGEGSPEEGNSGEGMGDQWMDALKGGGVDIDDEHYKWSDLEEHISDEVTKANMKRMIESAKSSNRGRMPGHLEDVIERLYKKPEIAWQKELRSAVRGQAKSFKKPTIMRRNRRLPNRGDLKGKLADRMVNVTAAVDVSGSVDTVQLEWIFSELYNILKMHKYNLNILLCDTQVQVEHRNVSNPNKLPMSIQGGGGTYFTPIFEYVDEHNIETNILVFFTDGFGEREIKYTPKQNYKTMFVITDKKEDLSVDLNTTHLKRTSVKELRYTEKR